MGRVLFVYVLIDCFLVLVTYMETSSLSVKVFKFRQMPGSDGSYTKTRAVADQCEIWGCTLSVTWILWGTCNSVYIPNIQEQQAYEFVLFSNLANNRQFYTSSSSVAWRIDPQNEMKNFLKTSVGTNIEIYVKYRKNNIQICQHKSRIAVMMTLFMMS